MYLVLAAVILSSACAGGEDAKVRERLIQVAQFEDMGTIGPNRDLVTLLFHQSLDVRRAALWAMGRIQDPSVVDDLAGAVTVDSIGLLAAAAWTMGQLAPLSTSNAPEGFINSLYRDTSSETRRNIMDALSHIQSPDVVDFMQMFGLTDGNPVVRGAAALALGTLGNSRYIRELSRLLRDPDVEVRWRTAWALWRLKDPASKASAENVLRDADPRVRMFAARALGEMGDETSADSLAPLLEDSDWRVRNEAAAAIGKIGKNDGVIDLLAGRLSVEPHELVLRTELEALGKIHRPQDQELIMGFLRHRSGTIWIGMINALAEGYPDKAAEVGAAMINDQRPWVRNATIEALGHVQTESARALLTNNYPNFDTVSKGFALAALAEYGFSYVDHYMDDALKSDNIVLAQNAVDVLSKAPTPENAARLSDFWSAHAADTVSDLKVTAAQTAGTMLAADSTLRAALQPWLVSALDDSDRLVRAAAIDALAKVGLDNKDKLGTFRTNITKDNYNDIFRAYKKNPRATISTEHGDIVIELRYDKAPRTVYNFVKLARQGFYDGIVFHRVVPNFVVQAGDPTGTGFGGPGYTIRSQYNDLEYSTGAVGMASSGKDTEGSQFFITHSPQPHLDDRYTIFGYVVGGQDAVDAIRQGDKIHKITVQE